MKPEYAEYLKRQRKCYKYSQFSESNNKVFFEINYKMHRFVEGITDILICMAIYGICYTLGILTASIIVLAYSAVHILFIAPSIAYIVSRFECVEIEKLDEDIIRSLKITQDKKKRRNS